MAKPAFQSVDEYIGAQPEPIQKTLWRVHQTIRQAVPSSREEISYNMPAYRLNGARLLHFAGWAKHYAIYGATEKLIAAFHGELAAYEIQKGAIRFPLSKPVPEKLIAQIAKFRAAELSAGEKANHTPAKR
jgi:uncharacterized protein YdhG (YjbR/CyaY superfamily)